MGLTKKNILGYLLLIILGGCFPNDSASTPLNSNVKIDTKWNDTTNHSVSMANVSDIDNIGFVRNPLLYPYEPNLFVPKGDATKKSNVALDEKAELFYSGNTHIIYILQQGDSITIKTSLQQNKITPVTLTANQQIRNNEIQFFEEAVINGRPLLYTESDNQTHGLIKAAPLVKSFGEINEIYKANIVFADNYLTKKPVSEAFKTFLYNYLQYDCFYKTLVYCSNATIDSLDKANFYPKEINHQNTYTNANYMLDAYLFNYNKRLNKQFNNINSFCAFANAKLGKYLSSRSIFVRLKNELANPQTEKYYATIQQEEFRIALENITKKNNELPYLINSLVNTNNEKVLFKDIFADTSKKLFYVDFWASWCLPCRNEFEKYDSLQQVFGNKVKFIFISIDKSMDSWKKAIAEEAALQKNDNFILYKADMALLKKYGLEAIPKYKLYDNKGKLINGDMPRPSDITLYEYLRNTLISN